MAPTAFLPQFVLSWDVRFRGSVSLLPLGRGASWQGSCSGPMQAGRFPISADCGGVLRLHPRTGTIEVRAADTQTHVADAVAIVALVQCLVYELAGRYDGGEQLPVHALERISEATYLAARDGLDGFLPDLVDGAPAPACERVIELAESLVPAARALGCVDELAHVPVMALAGGGAAIQRDVATSEGVEGLLLWLAQETAELTKPRLGDFARLGS